MAAHFTSLVEMQEKSCEKFARNKLFGTKKDGAYQWITYAEFAALVDRFRAALKLLGVERGDKVALIANNRVEWAVAAYATYGLGAHFSPMYEAQLPKEWKYIIEDSAAVVLIVSSEAIYDQVSDWAGKEGRLRHVLCIDALATSSHSWAAHMERGAGSPTPSVHPEPDEVAGLIYTSGTTGEPKGVVLTHGNIVSNINSVHDIFPMTSDDVSCSFLPWAHSFGQTVELHVLLSMGAALGIAESVNTLMDNFLEVKPTLLFSVPRVFNRIYDGLQKRMADEKPIKRLLFNQGLHVAEKRRKLAEKGMRSPLLDAQYEFFEKLVFSKIKARFGGRLRYAFSGGAALSREVAEFIDNIGILVFEGYGLSETAPIATANSPAARRIGTIGKPIPGVKIYICDTDGKKLPQGEEGEIVIVGPNVMKGYHNKDTATNEVIFDLEGERAFRSGDMGRIDPDGFVKITGRVKELYKLENGKYVAPAPLEEQLKLSQFVNHACIYGDNRPYNVVLISPDFETLGKWARQEGINAQKPAELAAHPRCHEKIGEEIQRFSGEFKAFEIPRKWIVLTEDFTTENDLLTPTLKLKRRNVIKRYQSEIEKQYA